MEDQKILLFEDILETGRSAAALKEHLEQYKAEVKLACFFSSDIAEIQPDYFLQKFTPQKYSFPWERFRE